MLRSYGCRVSGPALTAVAAEAEGICRPLYREPEEEI